VNFSKKVAMLNIFPHNVITTEDLL